MSPAKGKDHGESVLEAHAAILFDADREGRSGKVFPGGDT